MLFKAGSSTGSLSRSVYLSSTDVTSYYQCFGIAQEPPPGAIDGDCYVLQSGDDYLPYICSGGEWILIDDFSLNSTQASKIRDAIMSSGINIPSTSTALYAYFRNLSAQNANLDYLSSADITLKTSGRLHSDGYEQGTVRKLIDGELDPETTKKGFYQDYDGNAEFFRADIYQANMNEGVLNNVTVNGKLNSATLVTQVTDVIGDSYRNKDIAGGDKYWSEAEVVNTVKEAIPHNEVVSCVGLFGGTSFLQCIYVDDVSTSHNLGTQTAWLATCDAKVTASGGTNLYVNGTQSFPVSVQNRKHAFVLDYLGVGGQISGYSSAHYLEISCMKGTYYMVMPDFLDILTSTDGINWTVLKQDITDLKTNTTSNWGKKFVCGTDRMVYLSYSGSLFASSDGVTWTQSPNFTSLVWGGTGSTGNGCCLNFCNGKFYALVEGSAYAYESTDGLTWSQGFKMPYTSCPAMVYHGGKYTLFSFSKYTGYNAVLAISSTDLSTWSTTVTDTEIYQVCDATVTSDGTYVLAGYANSVSMGISFSRNLSSWSPVSNCNGGFYYSSITTDGTNVVCGNSYNASQVSVKYRFGGTLSYKLNYSMGLHFLSQATGAVFATPTANWRHDTSYLNYSGTRLYYNSSAEVSTPTVGYVFCGMQKLVEDEWTDAASGEVFKFQSVSVTYAPVGGSTRTVNAIQGITWNSTALTVSRENLSPVVIDSSIILASLSVSFAPVSMAQGNYTKSMFPLEEGMDIGAQDNKYHALYATTITGDYVYGAIWNDIADAVEIEGNTQAIPGRCYVLGRKGHSLSRRYAEKGTIGIHSDTFGFLLGKKDRASELNIAVGGFVLAYTDKAYSPGTPLTSSRDGRLTRMGIVARLLHPERLVGTFYRKETADFWYGIPVKGRHWIKVR